MATYYGPVTVPVDSYENFKSAVNGNSYEFDYIAGCQCVDLAKLLNYNLGYQSPYWSTGGTGNAYGGWTVDSARVFNASNKYILITDKFQIKKGDMLVFNHFVGNPYGHVGFADEDYPYSTYIKILSQNNGGVPAPPGGTTVNVANYNLNYFLGAYRLISWQEPVHMKVSKSKFPWVLYARKLRKQ